MGDAAEPFLTERYEQALAWAAQLHRSQVRKGTAIPYVSHVLGVSSLVLEHGGDEDQAIGGLLHDSIEDCGVTDADLVARFGPRVAEIVRACTDADTIPKPPWHERKAAYLTHLADAPAAAVLVSAADKVHNARALAADVEHEGEGYLDRFNAGPTGTRWYYRRLADAFAARPDDVPASLLLELERAIERFGATEGAALAYEAATA